VAAAAAGETVKAVLPTELRGEAKKVLVPKGTPVSCRILRIRCWSGHGVDTGRRRVELLLGLENSALSGGQRPVYAQPDRARSASTPRMGMLQSQPEELGPLHAMEQGQWFANFPRAGDNYVIKSGLASDWATATITRDACPPEPNSY
jgi:hypothetical protein